MPAQKRVKTNYPGVYYVESKATDSAKVEKIYYIEPLAKCSAWEEQ